MVEVCGFGVVVRLYVAVMVAVALAASLAMPDTRKHEYLEGEGQVENR